MVRARIGTPAGAPHLRKTAIISIPHSLDIIQLNVRSRQSIFFKIKYDGPLGLIREPGVDIRPLRTGQTACCEKDNGDVESGHRIVVFPIRCNYRTFTCDGLANQPISRRSKWAFSRHLGSKHTHSKAHIFTAFLHLCKFVFL